MLAHLSNRPCRLLRSRPFGGRRALCRTIGPARVDSCQDSTTPVGESQQGLTAFGAGPKVLLPSRWLTRRRPPPAPRRRGAGECWRMGRPVTRRACGALPPRLFASLSAPPPGVRGCAPLPPDPYPRQAELAGFCALPRACCAPRRVFLCWRMQRPAVCAAPEAIGAAGFPGGSLAPISARSSEPKVE